MVCISCIVVPLVLWIWHRFLQPIFLRIYNPWAKVEDQTSTSVDLGDQPAAELKCPLSAFQQQATPAGEEANKKTD